MKSCADRARRPLGGASLRSPRALASLAVLALVLSGCTNAPDVDYTVPADGATGVEASTEIVVAFTNELDPETATDAANFVVFGSTSGAATTTAALDESGRILTITVGEGGFESGEQVTVSLTSRMTTTISIPLDSYHFSFRIRGTSAAIEDFEPEDGEFLLSDLDPENGTAALAQRPLVRADFDRNVLVSTIDASVTIRGEQSGTRESSATGGALQGQGAQQTAGLVLAQIAPAEAPFEPGERVTIAFASSLQAPAPAGATAPLTLRPFVASYEARGGQVTEGFGPANPLALAAGTEILPAVEAFLGEFLQFEGPELILLDQAGTVHALRRLPEGPFVHLSSFQTALPAAIRAADVDDDGLLEILVVTKTGLLEVLQLIGQTLARAQEPVTIPGGEPFDFEVADLDGDGVLDLVVAVAEGLQFIQQSPGIPGLPGLPGLPNLAGFTPVAGDPLVVPVREVETGDLDGDGRIDVIARTAQATTILRNAGDFLFAEVSVLTVEPLPGTIRIADFDGDGRPEVLAGGIGGVFVHPNPGTGIPAPTWGATTLPLGLDPARIFVTNLDGDPDRFPDLLVYSPNAAEPLTLHVRESAILGDLTSVPIDVPGVAPAGGIALGDITRDGARDILVFGAGIGGAPQLLLSPSQGVIDAGDPSFAFSLTGPSEVDLGSDIDLEVAADLDDDISQFTVALSWHASFTLAEVELVPSTFPGASVVPTVQTGPGQGIITVDLGASAGDTVPLLELRFHQNQPQPGNFTFAIEESVTLSSGPTGASQVVLAGDGVAFPDISAGSVVVTLSSSVPSVTGLACAPATGGVGLSWTNAASYSEIRIRRNGAFLSSIPGSATSFVDESPLASGAITYQVVGVQNGIEALPASCEVSLFGQLTCTRLGESNSIRLSWVTNGSFDTISIQRDGNFIALVSGTQTGFTDNTGDQNGHVYSVYGTDGGVNSTPATCPEVPDTSAGAAVVDPVSNVVLTIEQGTATLTWLNGESYSGVQIRKNGVDLSPALPGAAAQFVEPDLVPGDYTYGVRGDADGVLGTFVFSGTVASDLPRPTDLSCTLAGGNSIQLEWTNGPVSYQYDAVRVERTAAGGAPEVVANLAGDATSYLDAGVPDGDYTYRVFGEYDALEAVSDACAASLANLFRIADLVTIPGKSATIAVDGQLLDTASGYSVTVRYDGERLSVLGVTVPGIDPAAVDWDVSPADSLGFRTIDIEVDGVAVGPGFDLALARIAVDTAADLSIVGDSPLAFTAAEVTFAGGAPFAPETSDGVLSVEPFGLFLEDTTALPGGIIEGWVYGTFASPIFGYQLAIQFDPEILTVLEITDQGTVGEEITGLVFSTLGNDEGFAALAQIVLPGPSGFVPITPRIAEPLAFVRLLVDPGAAPGETAIEIADFITPDPAEADFINAFFDEDVNTITPIGFPGTIEIVAPTTPPILASIDPSSGPAAGGTTVLLSGSGFGIGMQVHFGAIEVPASAIQVLSAGQALVITSPSAAGTVDVTVTTALGGDTLVDAYTFEPLAISAVIPTAVNPCVETSVVIAGTGFSQDLLVRIGDAFATVLDVSPEGTTADVVPPPFSLASPGGGTVVDVLVENPGGSTAILPGGLEYQVGAFVRGDVNGSGSVDIADVSFLGSALAGVGPLPANFDAADVDDDGIVHIGDVVYLSSFVSASGPPPPPPFPDPGFDPTPDGICP